VFYNPVHGTLQHFFYLLYSMSQKTVPSFVGYDFSAVIFGITVYVHVGVLYARVCNAYTD